MTKTVPPGSWPVPCGSCAGALFGPVRYCPQCGAAVEATRLAPVERAPENSSYQPPADDPRGTQGEGASSPLLPYDARVGPAEETKAPVNQTGRGRWGGIAAAAALAGLGGFYLIRANLVDRPPETPKLISGEVGVIDTETISVDGRTIKLVWVQSVGPKEAIQAFRDLILAKHGLKATCVPQGDRWRCDLGGKNISEILLMSGLSCLRPGAPEVLRAAESMARDQRLGIWALPSPCSSPRG